MENNLTQGKEAEVRELHQASFSEIKPKSKITEQECNSYWDTKTQELLSEVSSKEVTTNELTELIDNYSRDLHENSEYKDTLRHPPFSPSDLELRTPEQNSEMREQFVDLKAVLIKEWERINGCSWPTYSEDVIGPTGKVIRRAGDRYDMHHIQPLKLGGQNVAENITPLSADVHFDKQGIHAKNSPCSRLMDGLEARDNDAR